MLQSLFGPPSLRFKILLLFLFLSLPLNTFAGKPCAVCTNDVPDRQLRQHTAIECRNGHRIDRECINHYLQSIELQTPYQVSALKVLGPPCCGQLSSGAACATTLPIIEVMKLLTLQERAELQKRLQSALTPERLTPAKNRYADFQEGLSDVFNLRCPGERCGRILAPIEGCNAAQCENGDCRTHFCYLCFDKKSSERDAHRHLRHRHSEDFFEKRPGYIARYHWLVARKKIAALFDSEVNQKVRKAAIAHHQALLKARKMWPIPADIDTRAWIQEVRHSDLNHDEQIELLQNESIYQRMIDDENTFSLIDRTIRRLGGIVLKSLELCDAGGVAHPEWSLELLWDTVTDYWQSAKIICCRRGAGSTEPAVSDDSEAEDPPQPLFSELLAPAYDKITFLPMGAHRVSSDFVALGQMFHFRGLIWSGVPPRNFETWEAEAFCNTLGGRLPTASEYKALAQALGKNSPQGYNPDVIPDLRGRWFWATSDDLGTQRRIGFFGDRGDLYSFRQESREHLRCVKNA